MSARFIDIHIIQNVPPSCVNRDDTGAPKTATYGGVRRARVSSQAWKRATRQEFRNLLDDKDLGLRTTRAIGEIATTILAKHPELAPDEATAKATKVLEAANLKVAGKKRKNASEETTETGYLIFFSRRQIDALAELAVAQEKPDKKAAVEAANSHKGIEVSLFGRMVADNKDLTSDASVQVAHALSTHAVESESDYFTAVDDLQASDEPGAGMIGIVDFNSSTLYRYATINVGLLQANLNDDEAATIRAIEAFVQGFALSMPTGKQNTFANRTVPDAVILSVRPDQPVNLVGAFETAVATQPGGGTVAESCRRLAQRAKAVESFVAKPELTLVSTIGEEAQLPGLPEPMPLGEAISALSDYLRTEQA